MFTLKISRNYLLTINVYIFVYVYSASTKVFKLSCNFLKWNINYKFFKNCYHCGVKSQGFLLYYFLKLHVNLQLSKNKKFFFLNIQQWKFPDCHPQRLWFRPREVKTGNLHLYEQATSSDPDPREPWPSPWEILTEMNFISCLPSLSLETPFIRRFIKASISNSTKKIENKKAQNKAWAL